jgi:hypothetical protein
MMFFQTPWLYISHRIRRFAAFAISLGSTFVVAWIIPGLLVHQTGGRKIQCKMTSVSLPDLGSASSLKLDKKVKSAQPRCTDSGLAMIRISIELNPSLRQVRAFVIYRPKKTLRLWSLARWPMFRRKRVTDSSPQSKRSHSAERNKGVLQGANNCHRRL